MFTSVYNGATKIKSIYNGSTLILNNTFNNGIQMKTVIWYVTSTNFDIGFSHIVITRVDGTVVTINDLTSAGEFKFNLDGGRIFDRYSVYNYQQALNSSNLVPLYKTDTSRNTTALYYVFEDVQNIKSIQFRVSNYTSESNYTLAYTIKSCFPEDDVYYPGDIITLANYSVGANLQSQLKSWTKQ